MNTSLQWKTTPIEDTDWDHLSRTDRETVIRICGWRQSIASKNTKSGSRRLASLKLAQFTPQAQAVIRSAIKSATKRL